MRHPNIGMPNPNPKPVGTKTVIGYYTNLAYLTCTIECTTTHKQYNIGVLIDSSLNNPHPRIIFAIPTQLRKDLHNSKAYGAEYEIDFPTFSAKTTPDVVYDSQYKRFEVNGFGISEYTIWGAIGEHKFKNRPPVYILGFPGTKFNGTITFLQLHSDNKLHPCGKQKLKFKIIRYSTVPHWIEHKYQVPVVPDNVIDPNSDDLGWLDRKLLHKNIYKATDLTFNGTFTLKQFTTTYEWDKDKGMVKKITTLDYYASTNDGWYISTNIKKGTTVSYIDPIKFYAQYNSPPADHLTVTAANKDSYKPGSDSAPVPVGKYTSKVINKVPPVTATQIQSLKDYDCGSGTYIKANGTVLLKVGSKYILVPLSMQPYRVKANSVIAYVWAGSSLATASAQPVSLNSCSDRSGSLSFSRQKDELKVTAKTNGQMTLKISVKDKTGMHPIGKWKVVNMLTIPVQLSSFVTPLTVYALLGFETPDGFKVYTSKKLTVENFKSNATPKVVNYTVSPKTVHKGDPVTLTIQMSEKTSYDVTVYLIPTDATAKASIKNMQTVSFNGKQAIKFPTKSYNSSTLVYTFNAPGPGEYEGYVVIEVK